MIDWTNLLCGLGGALIGALIGTYLGSYFITIKQQERYKNIRDLAKKSLNIFKKYENGTYSDASKEFNKSLNLTEKRIILVALHKVGIPFSFESRGKFNIDEIFFNDNTINSGEMDNMILQIESGNCDHLFFEDPEEYFNKNLLILYKRNIAIKYMVNVLGKSKINTSEGRIYYPERWWEHFSLGEINAISVIKDKLADLCLFDESTGTPKQEKIEEIIKEIDIGLWDMYLNWSYEAFSNLQIQKNFANLAISAISTQQAIPPATHKD